MFVELLYHKNQEITNICRHFFYYPKQYKAQGFLSGKSTLAKLLNGLLLPTSGDVKIFGNSTLDPEKIYEIRKNVGMVFQNPDKYFVYYITD